MRSRIFQLALLSSLFACAAAHAADPAASPPVEPAPVASAPLPALEPAPAEGKGAGKMVPAGTIVVLELTEPLSANSAKSGDHFGLRLVEPIMIDGSVVIQSGVTGQGEVIDAKPAGIGGRPGRLILAARYLDGGGQRIKLQSFKIGGAGGRDNSGLAVGATIAVGIVGALIPGGGVDYQPGASATAKISTDITIAPGPSAASPPPETTPKP